MPLDPQEPISPLQSATIRAAIYIIIVKVTSILGLIGVSAVYVEAINHYSAMIAEIGSDGIAIVLAFRVIRGRINATETIKKGP